MSLDATNKTPRTGLMLRMARINSSQQAMPPPRSLAQVHQSLRGVIHKRGQCSIRALNRCKDVECLRGRSFRVCDDGHFRSTAWEVSERVGFFVRNL